MCNCDVNLPARMRRTISAGDSFTTRPGSGSNGAMRRPAAMKNE